MQLQRLVACLQTMQVQPCGELVSWNPKSTKMVSKLPEYLLRTGQYVALCGLAHVDPKLRLNATDYSLLTGYN